MRQYRPGAGRCFWSCQRAVLSRRRENPEAGAAEAAGGDRGFKVWPHDFCFRLPNACFTSYAQCYLAWDVKQVSGWQHLDETEAGGGDSGAGRGEAPSAPRKMMNSSRLSTWRRCIGLWSLGDLIYPASKHHKTGAASNLLGNLSISGERILLPL